MDVPKSQRLCVTDQEKVDQSDPNKITKVKLRKLVFLELEKRNATEAKLLEEIFQKNVHNQKHQQYVDFYHMVNDHNN